MKTNDSKSTIFLDWVHVSSSDSGGSGKGSVVGHVSGGGAELGVGLDDLVDGLQEVLLGGDLPAGSNGKHAGLCAHAADLGTWQGSMTEMKTIFFALRSSYQVEPAKLLLTASTDVDTD